MLDAVKMALRISSDAYDDELEALIAAAEADLGIIGVTDESEEDPDPLIAQAVKTYVRMSFGSPDDYDRLKKSYDEQKAQLQTASGYGLGGDE